MPLAESARIAAAFARTRFGLRFRDRAALLKWQAVQVARFLAEALPRASFYRGFGRCGLEQLPVVDKATMLAGFDGFNVRGITLERALAVAVQGERTRDFAPALEGLAVGLSSGTSGTRGVFLVSAEERARWAGIALARVLTGESLRQLMDPRRPPLRVSFFLRANSALYATLGGRRVRFEYHDLLQPLEAHVARLKALAPDVLVGPPTVLLRLAENARELRIAPRQVVSVAEVLEDADAHAVETAFGAPVQQVYQCTEGFLGSTCARGRLHLEEEHVHVEAEWLDDGRRFQPVITDFSRRTQLFVRYRLDDVLRVGEAPCPCGRASLTLAAIEGRADETLWLPSRVDGSLVAILPDVLRRALALAGPALRDYRIEQRGDELRIRLDGAAVTSVRSELEALWGSQGVRPPTLTLLPWVAQPLHEKRRRIRCLAPPPQTTTPGALSPGRCSGPSSC